MKGDLSLSGIISLANVKMARKWNDDDMGEESNTKLHNNNLMFST